MASDSTCQAELLIGMRDLVRKRHIIKKIIIHMYQRYELNSPINEKPRFRSFPNIGVCNSFSHHVKDSNLVYIKLNPWPRFHRYITGNFFKIELASSLPQLKAPCAEIMIQLLKLFYLLVSFDKNIVSRVILILR